MPRTRSRLGSISAVWHAFWGTDLSYFPRFIESDGEEQRVDADDLIRRVSAELGSLERPPDDKIEALIRRGRESLDEVKGLTEYEDQKATRNLTIITFLTALAGVLFSRFADLYPLQETLKQFGLVSWEGGLVVAGYSVFLAFVMCAIFGALVIFHATRIRFKYPDLVMDQANDAPRSAKSFLFFREIIQVPSEVWARSFLEVGTTESDVKTLRQDLSVAYLRNYIIESYLIAAKVADKLRYLMPAQTILSFSIKVLLVWLVTATATVIVVPEQSKDVGAVNPPTSSAPAGSTT